VKALTVRQPWAWLIVNGWKNVENRTWPTDFRGPLLIHAAKGCTGEEWEAAYVFVAGFAPRVAEMIPRPAYIQLGGIVGEATIMACVTGHLSEWFCGPYGFVLCNQKPLPFRPCKGALGLWEA
jgi:hypothetical protein